MNKKLFLDCPQEVPDEAFKIDILRAALADVRFQCSAKIREASMKTPNILRCFSRDCLALFNFTFGSNVEQNNIVNIVNNIVSIVFH